MSDTRACSITGSLVYKVEYRCRQCDLRIELWQRSPGWDFDLTDRCQCNYTKIYKHWPRSIRA